MKELIRELEKYNGLFMTVPDTSDITMFDVHDVLAALKAGQAFRDEVLGATDVYFDMNGVQATPIGAIKRAVARFDKTVNGEGAAYEESPQEDKDSKPKKAQFMTMELSRGEIKNMVKALGGMVGWPWWNAKEPLCVGDTVSLKDRGGREVIISVVQRDVHVIVE